MGAIWLRSRSKAAKAMVMMFAFERELNGEYTGLLFDYSDPRSAM